MKILVLQLTRLGDILVTWPTLRALRRQYPQAELHFAVRKRFSDACVGLDEVDRLWLLDSDELLRPMLDEKVDVEASLARLSHWVREIQRETYDLVINLSFSPSSSFLTQLVQPDRKKVRGYTRFSDGSLCIADEVSSYFYAQVGVDRSNRVHVASLLADIAGVTLMNSDWRPPQLNHHQNVSSPFIALHIGASTEGKNYPAGAWAQVIGHLREWWSGEIVMLGDAHENKKASDIETLAGTNRLKSLVGKTKVFELFSIIHQARLLIGPDSSLIHVASLTQTPCLNLSFSSVNFWETGPRSPGSRIIWSENPDTLEASVVSLEAHLLVESQPGHYTEAEVYSYDQPYTDLLDHEDFGWRLVKHIYFSGPPPEARNQQVKTAYTRLMELNALALEQIQKLSQNPKDSISAGILDRVDELLKVMCDLMPAVAPLVRWIQAEKSRIAPGTFNEVLEQTWAVHQRFSGYLDTLNSPYQENNL